MVSRIPTEFSIVEGFVLSPAREYEWNMLNVRKELTNATARHRCDIRELTAATGAAIDLKKHTGTHLSFETRYTKTNIIGRLVAFLRPSQPSVQPTHRRQPK